MFMSNLITEPKIAGFAQTTPRRASTCCELSDSEQKAICPLKRDKSQKVAMQGSADSAAIPIWQKDAKVAPGNSFDKATKKERRAPIMPDPTIACFANATSSFPLHLHPLPLSTLCLL